MKKRAIGGWFRVVLILACGAGLLGGCQSTPERRIAKKEAVFSSWSAQTQAKIRGGQIEVGFTPQQVEMAKGKPDRVGRRTTKAGDRVEWVYLWNDSRFSLGFGLGLGRGNFEEAVDAGTEMSVAGVATRVFFTAGVVSAFEHYSQ
ncbi:MAG: hypothetical protein NTU80_05055 [Verrucomicrobia bacterium]|nr:hypothetical protein [Verrucomicrobiota bacterium]